MYTFYGLIVGCIHSKAIFVECGLSVSYSEMEMTEITNSLFFFFFCQKLNDKRIMFNKDLFQMESILPNYLINNDLMI